MRLYKTSLIIMYYIASLAKFGNCCGMTWARKQGQWKGKNFGSDFLMGGLQTIVVAGWLAMRYNT